MSRPPNVIHIYADDLGRGMLSCYGQKHFATPNIDRLAREGVRFTNFYGCVFCAPARASLLLGLHDCHRGTWTYSSGNIYARHAAGRITLAEIAELIHTNSLQPGPGDIFLAQVAKQAGYVTAEIGKLAVENFKPRTSETYGGDGYAWTFGYVGSLQFTKITGDTSNNEYLVSKFDCNQQGPDNGTTASVDTRAFGNLPLEIYLQTQKVACRTLGLARADAQWSRTTSDGITSDARYWIDDMYMITSLQVFAYRATKDTKYLDRAAKTMLAYIAELVVDFAFDVARLVVVKPDRVGSERRLRIEHGGQRFEVELDQIERRARGRFVHRGDRRDRFAAIANALARQRKLVLRDRDHAVRHVAVVAGDDRANARNRSRRARFDAADPRMRERAAQDRADQRAVTPGLRRQIRGVKRAAGHLLDPVDQRLSHADRGRCGMAQRLVPRRVHGLDLAAACTDSTIFT